MILSDIIRGILVLTIPLFVYLNMMVPVYIVVFLIFSATRFFLPSKLAFIPNIVPKDKLIIANSLSNTTRMIATILGFALAGFIVSGIGHTWGFYLDGASYFVSASLIGLIIPKKRFQDVKKEMMITKELIGRSIRKDIWRDIVEGLGHMVKKDKMKIVTSTLFLLMAGAGSVFCIIIVFVQEAFGSVTKDLGILGVFLGVGLFIGTILYGKTGHKFSKIRTMFLCFSVCGVFISVFAVYTSNDPALLLGGVLMMLVGAAVAPIFTCANTLIHMLVPDEVRGRIFSSMEAVIHLAFLLFMFITAWLSRYLPNVTILLISGVVFALAGICGLIFVREKDLTG